MYKIRKWLQEKGAPIAGGLVGVLFLTAGFMAFRYPTKMRETFVSSSIVSKAENLETESVFTNENVEMNYKEMRLMAGLITPYLDGTDDYKPNVYKIMNVMKEKMNFSFIGIRKMDAINLFATLSDGKHVQLDMWALDSEFSNDDVSVEIQTSPFRTADAGKDAVVYRYKFYDSTGTAYMLIAEKPQDTMRTVLNIDEGRSGVTYVIRKNGNIVYSKGALKKGDLSGYNILAYLEKMGATKEFTRELGERFQEATSGQFTLNMGDENYYFVYHKINNTNWLSVQAFSERELAGSNLELVNSETLRLVFLIGLLLMAGVGMVALISLGNVQRKNNAKALEREHLFEEMSKYIPEAFAIKQEGVAEPTFISYNFKEIVGDSNFSFDPNVLAKWLDIELTDELKTSYHKNGYYEKLIQKGEKWLSFGIYYIGEFNGKNYNVITFIDSTASVNSRELLKESLARADAASQSKTSFLSSMSHEIRTPLNAVIGFSKLVLERWDTADRDVLKDYVNKVQLSGNYLLDLVSDILDVSRIEEGRFTVNKSEYSLDLMVNECYDAFQGQMENKKINYVLEKNYDNTILSMDTIHIKQILNNLISNAAKYTEEGGTVALKVDSQRINDKQMGVTFRIKDSGIGMSPEFLEKIFEPFSQDTRGDSIKNQLRGTGLGMSICKNMVELLGGKISVTSKIGEGSEFTVRLTFDVVAEADAAVDNEQEMDYGFLKGKKILVVDDVELNRMIIEDFLEPYELEFEDAEDGEQAVEKFMASEPGEYLTIFMDVRMPKLNGMQATETIRASEHADAPTIPIVGMTADAFSEDVNNALASGMNYHVTKPIDIDKVLKILAEICKNKGLV